ncbi:MAG: GIY-YIG nuclease family protein [Selenomonadaceae bacterium]|nr:GIY-YIG nuclease family protein [Selenomonadaceae bacterium]MBR4384767.1 GIY-YIG nuclease family protein [Selenomonadaceae bacterium]
MEVYGSIYAIIDGTNDFEYIGQTIRSVEERFKEHTKADSRIGYAIRAHGEDMFVVVVLKVCHSKDELDYWERRLIKSRNTKFPNGYNLTGGGEGTVGLELTPEQRAKISAALKGKKKSPRTPEQCAKISEALTGKTRSQEQCAHLSAALKSKPRSPEHCANLSESHKGEKNPFFGKHHTPEHCAKMSMTLRAYSPYKNLLAELDARQMSYAALAKLMSLHYMTISGKMRDKCNFTERDKVKLAEIFGKPIEYLLARDE